MTCTADLILFGTAFHTMDGGVVDALGIRDGRIVALGRETLACAGPRVDLDGAVVLPGFVDAHAHPVDAGLAEQGVVLGDASTPDEVMQAVANWRAAHPGAAWVVGGGWDASKLDAWAPLAELDTIDRPVFLTSADGHSAWVNSAAVRRSRLDDAPSGGRLEMRDGVFTGTVREAAVDVVDMARPPPTRREVAAAVATALSSLAKYGLTTVADVTADRKSLAAWRRADRAGLTVWVAAAVTVEPRGDVRTVRRWAARFDGSELQVTAVKLFVDGVIESRTARMLAPYTTGDNGDILFSDAELDAILHAADAAGLQVHAHVIGDGAVRQLLDAVERTAPHAQSILAAHVEVIDPGDVTRFAPLGVWPDVQALWAWPDPYVTELTWPVVGAERGARLYPFADLAQAGATLVAGSDWDVTTLNPWPAIEVAVTRRNPDEASEALGPEQALTLDAILRAYTVDGARGVRGEGGRLAIGEAAARVVLDRDRWSVPVTELSEVRVLQTWFAGRPVWPPPSPAR